MNPADCKCTERHCSDPSCKSVARSRGAVTEVDRFFPAEEKALGLQPRQPFGKPPAAITEREPESIRDTFL